MDTNSKGDDQHRSQSSYRLSRHANRLRTPGARTRVLFRVADVASCTPMHYATVCTRTQALQWTHRLVYTGRDRALDPVGGRRLDLCPIHYVATQRRGVTPQTHTGNPASGHRSRGLHLPLPAVFTVQRAPVCSLPTPAIH